jgi:hypothetical protein
MLLPGRPPPGGRGVRPLPVSPVHNDAVPAPLPPRPVSDRPLAVLDIIDGAFAALRQRPRVLVGVVLPIVVPLRVIEAWASRNVLGGLSLADVWADPSLAETGVGPGFGADLWVLSHLVESAAVTVGGVGVAVVMAGWLEGRDVSAGRALAVVARRWWAVALAWLLVRLIQLAAGALFVLPAVFAVALLSVVSPVLAFERLGPWQAVRRSVQLVRPRLGPVLGVVLLVGAVSFGISQAVESIPGIFAVALGPDRAWGLVAAATIVSSLVTVPFVAASATLVYLDQRYRLEGLDLEREAEEVLPGVG